MGKPRKSGLMLLDLEMTTKTIHLLPVAGDVVQLIKKCQMKTTLNSKNCDLKLKVFAWPIVISNFVLLVGSSKAVPIGNLRHYFITLKNGTLTFGTSTVYKYTTKMDFLSYSVFNSSKFLITKQK